MRKYFVLLSQNLFDNALGFSLKSETMPETLTLDIMKSSEIEGEKLNRKQVRSSAESFRKEYVF